MHTCKHDPGRLAGIDFGTKRIGIALTDVEQRIASPYQSYSRRDRERDAGYFQSLVQEQRIVTFVVGLPLRLDGGESQKSAQARQFGQWLEDTTGVPVVFFDERFTTVEAEDALWQAGLTHKRRRQRRDMVAAQIILAGYLEKGDRSIFS